MAKILNPNAAGIDISSKDFYVAVNPEQYDKVKVFGSFTEDIHCLAKWLLKNDVDTVAMESTGIYWIHLFTVLEEYGIEVYLVNAHHVKNVPGRKTDVQDAQWLQELHSYGMLRGSFQPDNIIRELRSYIRTRKQTIQEMSKETLRMQKSLETMNIKLNNVLRDITGKTGLLIIEAILSGERNAKVLSEYRDKRVKATKETIEKSLVGNWRKDQIFNLKLSYDRYKFYKDQLSQIDDATEELLKSISNDEDMGNKVPIKKKRKGKNSPKYSVANYLYKMNGVDVTAIPGLSEITSMTVFSEIGGKLQSSFKTVKHFLSWVNLVPNNRITGGKVISSRMKKTKNVVGQAFRDAANALWNDKGPLGEYLRRKKAKSGGKAAIIATAKKIATIYYKMIIEKVPFDIEQLKKNSIKYTEKKLEYFKRMALKLESDLIENQNYKKSVI